MQDKVLVPVDGTESFDETLAYVQAMVSHGLSGNRRALEESVTADVIRHSNCPLLVWSASPQCPTYL
jgi:hypothetical protein